MIQRQYSSFYDWEYSDSPEIATITINFPETFNSSILEFTLNNDKDSILALIPHTVPFLCGCLFEKAAELTTEINECTLKIFIKKEKEGEWPLPIKSLHKELKTIDPKSAFLCYQQLSSIDSEETGKWAYQMLLASSNAGYLPALQVHSAILMQTEGKEEEAIKYLRIGVELYNDALCAFHLGLLYITFKNDCESALYYLQHAVDNGYTSAYFTMGQVYSPISRYNYEKKDAKKALECFLSIPEEDRPPGVLSELADFYEQGLGCEKDLKKAEELRAKANEMIEEIKRTQLHQTINNEEQPVDKIIEKEAEDEKEQKKHSRAIFLATTAIASAIGFIVYKKFKGKK